MKSWREATLAAKLARLGIIDQRPRVAAKRPRGKRRRDAATYPWAVVYGRKGWIWMRYKTKAEADAYVAKVYRNSPPATRSKRWIRFNVKGPDRG